MNPTDVIAVIEGIAPRDWQSAWDHSGVQVASLRQGISHVGVALDPLLSTVESAVAAGVDFIVTHHPLSMTPRYPDRADTYLQTLSLLLGHQAWLYSAHTSLDANPHGPVCWLAHALALKETAVLEPQGICPVRGISYGFGFVGTLAEPMEYAAFTQRLASLLGKANWSFCKEAPQQVRRVACCPGSGSSLMQLAMQAQADVFITGDVKYHAALEASVHTIDPGHFILEEQMMQKFAVELRKSLSVPVTFFAGADPLHVAG